VPKRRSASKPECLPTLPTAAGYSQALRRAGTGPPGIAGLPKQKEFCPTRGLYLAMGFLLMGMTDFEGGKVE